MKRITDKKVRSLGSQVDRMKHSWPQLEHRIEANGYSFWRGPIIPYQAVYEIGIIWKVGSDLKPWVLLISPELKPRDGGAYEEIPHLLFDNQNPKLSGLCLFDPDGGEWTNKRLIADTTIPWAMEWLQHYEFWHYCGIWKGKSIGPESIAEIRASTIHKPEG